VDVAQPDTTVTVNPLTPVVDSAESMLQTLFAALPRIALAFVVFLLVFGLSRVVAWLLRRSLRRTRRSDSFAEVLSTLVRSTIVFAGFLLALVVAVPSMSIGRLVGGLGIGTIAIGFAFQDILQNTLAGLLILFRQPFRIGDQIEVSGIRGTVIAVHVRETQLRQFDGQRVLIPNKDVYASIVTVQTANEAIRTNFHVGVDYDADLDRACEVARTALATVEGVLDHPPVEALFCEQGTSAVVLDVRYWTRPQEDEVRTVLDRAVRAVTQAFNEAGLEIPTQIVELESRPSMTEALSAARARTDADG
jgi:small conductance mechanosensitive channel